MNTDQGSQYTSSSFISVLESHGIRMDRKGCWRDNVFVERLWRSIKYEEAYLHGYDIVTTTKAGIARYLAFYRRRRPNQRLDGQPPNRLCFN